MKRMQVVGVLVSPAQIIKERKPALSDGCVQRAASKQILIDKVGLPVMLSALTICAFAPEHARRGRASPEAG